MKTDTKTLAAAIRTYSSWFAAPIELTATLTEAADRLEELERELESCRVSETALMGDLLTERARADRLRKSAQALVDRWETPFWKDAPHTGKFIRSLDDALAAWKEARSDTPAEIDAHLDECVAKSAVSWKPLPGDLP